MAAKARGFFSKQVGERLERRLYMNSEVSPYELLVSFFLLSRTSLQFFIIFY